VRGDITHPPAAILERQQLRPRRNGGMRGPVADRPDLR
jgi:hypothetical protein